MANRSTLHVKDVSDATKELIRRYRIEHQVSSGRAVDELIAAGVAILDNPPVIFSKEEKPRD